MTVLQIAIYIISIISILVLGLLVFYKNPREKVNRTFFFFVLATVLWLWSLFFYYIVESSKTLLLLGRFNFAIVIILLYYIFRFAIIFPKETVRIPRFFKTAVGLWSIVLFLFTLLTPYIVTNEFIVGEIGRQTIFGPLYFLFVAEYLFFTFLSAFLVFYKLKKTSEKTERYQALYFISGLGLALFWGFVTNILFPYAGIFWVQNYGPLAPLFFVALIVYAIFKHHLFDIRIIAIQLFIFLLVFILFTRLLISEALQEYLLNGVLFVATTFFGILLLRSVYKEISDRERIADLANELQKSNAELKKLDQVKSEFISLASHQLRTPLTVIRGYLSMIFEESFGPVSGELKRPLTNVMLSAEQLIRLVNDLLDLSRIETGRIQYEMTAFPVADMVEKVVTALSGTAKERGIEMRFVNSIPADRIITGDLTKLSSAVMNVVDNAVKHSQAHHIEITLQEKTMEEHIIDISVRDDGIGIAAGDLPKLFGKFSHIGNKSRYERVTGLGIGLYFTKKVVEDHHGRVWAESAGLGKGSTFHVELLATIGDQIKSKQLTTNN